MRVKVFKNTTTNRYFSNFTVEKEIESVGNPSYARVWDVKNIGRMANFYNFKKLNNDHLTSSGYEPVTLWVEEVEK